MQTTRYPLSDVRQHIIGIDTPITCHSIGSGRAVNLDNAASTPALRPAQVVVDHFLSWYSSIHRGAGLKSQVSTAAYEDARAIVGRFVGARPGQHQVIFTRNTTEALNLLARRINLRPGQVVISTEIEHHSNDLPWRGVAPVFYACAHASGTLDEDHLSMLLRQHAGRVRVVAVSGGSNVTGYIPNIHHLAELVHAAGAEIAVDAAQLAAHRTIDMGDLDDPAHLDYVAISGHKLYAPYGSGALIGRADIFALGAPMLVGGGSVRRVTPRIVDWADGPARDEAGTPNVVGAVALAAALAVIDEIGMPAIAAHEAEITAYAITRLCAVPGLRLYGDDRPELAHTRLGVLPFSLSTHSPHLVAAILSCEYGIAVRSGSFCAQPYLRRLLNTPHVGCTHGTAGLVRASFGIYNTTSEVDMLADALLAIANGIFDGAYQVDPATNSYHRQGWDIHPDEHFHFDLAPGSRLAR